MLLSEQTLTCGRKNVSSVKWWRKNVEVHWRVQGCNLMLWWSTKFTTIGMFLSVWTQTSDVLGKLLCWTPLMVQAEYLFSVERAISLWRLRWMKANVLATADEQTNLPKKNTGIDRACFINHWKRRVLYPIFYERKKCMKNLFVKIEKHRSWIGFSRYVTWENIGEHRITWESNEIQKWQKSSWKCVFCMFCAVERVVVWMCGGSDTSFK